MDEVNHQGMALVMALLTVDQLTFSVRASHDKGLRMCVCVCVCERERERERERGGFFRLLYELGYSMIEIMFRVLA